MTHVPSRARVPSTGPTAWLTWPWSRPRIRRISGRPQGVFPRHGGEGEGRRAEPRSHPLGDAAGCRAEATSEDGQRRRIAPAADTAMGLTRRSAAVIEENCVRTEAGRRFSPIRGTTRHPMLGLSEQSSHSRTASCSPAVSRVRNRRVAAAPADTRRAGIQAFRPMPPIYRTEWARRRSAVANAKAGEFNLARTICGSRQAPARNFATPPTPRRSGTGGRRAELTVPAMTCWRGEDERACVVIAPRQRRRACLHRRKNGSDAGAVPSRPSRHHDPRGAEQ
jgi:hypothetical protein